MTFSNVMNNYGLMIPIMKVTMIMVIPLLMERLMIVIVYENVMMPHITMPSMLVLLVPLSVLLSVKLFVG